MVDDPALPLALPLQLVDVAALPLQLEEVAALPVQEAEDPEMLLEMVPGNLESLIVPDEMLEAFSEDREAPLPEKVPAYNVLDDGL